MDDPGDIQAFLKAHPDAEIIDEHLVKSLRERIAELEGQVRGLLLMKEIHDDIYHARRKEQG